MVAQTGQPSAGQNEAPKLTEDYNVPDLPVLSPGGKKFIATYISSNFNLAAAAKAASLPLEKAHLYTTDPGIQAHLEAHFRFLHSTLKCVAAGARHTLIARLTKLLAECDDPEEQSRLLVQLQRATAASIVPAGHARGVGAEAQASNGRAPARVTRPAGAPFPSYTPEQVGSLVMDSLVYFDRPDENSALATIASFAADRCEVNGESLPVEDDAQCVEILEHTGLRELQRCMHYSSRKTPHVIERDRAVLHYEAILSKPGTWNRSSEERSITITLAKQGANSVYPSCWLIESLTTERLNKPP